MALGTTHSIMILISSKLQGRGIEDTAKQMREMRSLQRPIRDVGKAFNELGVPLSNAFNKTLKLENAFSVLSMVLGPVGTAIGAVSLGFDFLQSFLKSAIDLLGRLISTGMKAAAVLAALGTVALTTFSALTIQATEYASKLENMWDALYGIYGRGVPAYIRAMKEASSYQLTHEKILEGTNKAYTLWGDTLSRKLPEALPYLTKIAAAQGESLEKVMDSLVTGIGRLSTRWRVNLGVTVDLAEATARASELFGKEAGQLTYAEKQAGMYDLVLKKLKVSTANMSDPLDSMLGLSVATQATWKDITEIFGRQWLPVGQRVAKLFFTLTMQLYDLMNEGGALWMITRKLSATFAALFDILLAGAEDIIPNLVGPLNDFASRLEQLAWDALEWGAQIATNLAIGLVRGASAALSAASGILYNLFADWFAPGSPPKFLGPDLLKWGAATFTEYLQSFQEADFQVLESLGSLLKKSLSVLADLGQISPTAGLEMYLSISVKMAEALNQISTSGSIANDVLERLNSIGGGLGSALKDLFLKNLKLAKAMRDVADAEERLNAARRLEETSSKRLSKAAREYNRLLKEGASPSVLREKLKQAKQEYKNLQLAREQKEQAEEDLEVAKEQEKKEKRRVNLQEDLLRRLLDLYSAQAELNKLREKEEEGEGPGYQIPEMPAPNVRPVDQAFEDLVERIKGKFLSLWEEMKADFMASGVGQLWLRAVEQWQSIDFEAIRDRITGAFAPIVTWFEKNWPNIQKIFSGVWQNIQDIFWSVVDTIVEVAWPSLKDAFSSIKETLSSWGITWDSVLTGALTLVAVVIGAILGFFALLAATFTGVVTGLTNAFEYLAKGWKAIIQNIKGILEGFIRYFTGIYEVFAGIFTGDWPRVLNGFKNLWIGAWEIVKNTFLLAWNSLKTGFTTIYGFIEGFIEGVIEFFKNLYDRLVGRSIITDLVNKMKSIFTNGLNDIKERISEFIRDAIAAISNKLNNWYDIGRNIIDSLVKGIRSAPDSIKRALQSIIDDAIEAIRKRLLMYSPSKVLVSMGENMRKSLFMPFKKPPEEDKRSIADYTTSALEGIRASAATPVAGSGGGQVVINNYFGRDSVRSDDDIDKIAEAIARKKSLRGVRDELG